MDKNMEYRISREKCKAFDESNFPISDIATHQQRDYFDMSKISISTLEEQWDVLEKLHLGFVQFWEADQEVGSRFILCILKCIRFTPIIVDINQFRWIIQTLQMYSEHEFPIKIILHCGKEKTSWAEKKKAEAAAKKKVTYFESLWRNVQLSVLEYKISCGIFTKYCIFFLQIRQFQIHVGQVYSIKEQHS